MKKSWICFLLIGLIYFGCNNSTKVKTDLAENTIAWNNYSIITNNHLNNFIEEYLKDEKLKNCNNYFLFMQDQRDTTVMTVYPMKVDFDKSLVQPMGIFKKNDKKIFILMHLSFLFKNDTSTSIVNENYENSLKEISSRNIKVPNKIWMLKIPRYCDTSFTIKDRKYIHNYLQPKIISD